MSDLYARVSPQLLAELPRFFQSFEAALGEIFQNAYRSGASLVTVRSFSPPSDDSSGHCSDGRVLEIADNGPGIDDPQRLLTAGESGWGENVFEPAGVGAFAILREEYVARVEYESRAACAGASTGWRMSLTPDALKGAPARVEWGTPRGDASPRIGRNGNTFAPNGLVVRLFLAPQVQVDEETLRRARAFYPFRVIFHNGAEEKELLPLRSWEPDLAAVTPVGVVEWIASRPYRYAQHDPDEAVWECRPIASPALTKALARAAQQHPQCGLATHLVGRGCARWFVDPASGVRPKLPDRSELLADEALESAAAQIVETLTARVLEVARETSQGWPDRVENTWSFSLPLPEGRRWLLWVELARILLPILGWRWVEYTDLGRFVVYDSLDGYEVEPQICKFFDRNALEVPSDALVLTLNTLGHPASLNRAAPNPRVIVSGLRTGEESPHIALAERIEVEGVGMIPYLLTEQDHFDLPGLEGMEAGVIFAGSPEECVGFIQESDELVHLVAHRANAEGELYDWLSWEEGELSLDHDAVRRALTMQVTQAFQADLTTARDCYYKAVQVPPMLREAECQISTAAAFLGETADSVLAACVPALQEQAETLRQMGQAVARRVEELAQAARI